MIGGPNGAGKTTAAPVLLHRVAGVTEFVNADAIAQQFTNLEPEPAAIAAGRDMLARLRELAEKQISFGFETTLASRSFAPWLRELIQTGYRFHLVYLWLPTSDIAVARVRARVLLRGHDVPEETIRRRYNLGLRNFFELYQPIARTWRVFDSSADGEPRPVAQRLTRGGPKVFDEAAWATIQQGASR
jgi:predicted ABC-type ATPase